MHSANGLFLILAVIAVQTVLIAGQGATKRELPYFCLGKPEEFFVCHGNNQCVNKRAVCDGNMDCTDNSDEERCTCVRNKDCPKKQKCRRDRELATSECTPCSEGKRFNAERQQCEDINECILNPEICAGKGTCVNYDGGYACVHCPKGYEGFMHNWRDFVTANRTLEGPNAEERRDDLRRLFLCNDEDECAGDVDPCRTSDSFHRQTVCVNTIGNFSCHCPPFHKTNDIDPDDNICRAIGDIPQIAIGQDKSIEVYDLRSETLVMEISLDEPLVDLATYKSSIIFFADNMRIYEYRLPIESKSLVLDLDEDGDFSSQIRKITVDWINRRIYFLTGDSISVTNFFGEAARLIEHRGNISTIAVDPVARYLFYSEQGFVRRTHLDGRPESTVTIFQALNTRGDENDHVGEALTLDPNLGSLYYVFDRILYSFDYSGHHAVVVSTHAQFGYLEPFENRLFAAYRSKSMGVVSVPRSGYTVGRREGRASTVTFTKTQPRTIGVLHSVKHPQDPRRNSTCSHSSCGFQTNGWCFPLPTNQTPDFRCACGRADATSPILREDCVKLTFQMLRPVHITNQPEDYSDDEANPNCALSISQSPGRLLQTLAIFTITFLLGSLRPNRLLL